MEGLVFLLPSVFSIFSLAVEGDKVEQWGLRFQNCALGPGKNTSQVVVKKM